MCHRACICVKVLLAAGTLCSSLELRFPRTRQINGLSCLLPVAGGPQSCIPGPLCSFFNADVQTACVAAHATKAFAGLLHRATSKQRCLFLALTSPPATSATSLSLDTAVLPRNGHLLPSGHISRLQLSLASLGLAPSPNSLKHDSHQPA